MWATEVAMGVGDDDTLSLDVIKETVVVALVTRIEEAVYGCSGPG